MRPRVRTAIRWNREPAFHGLVPGQEPPERTPDISLRALLRTVPIVLLTSGGLLLAGGGAQAASSTHYPVMMKRLAAIPSGTTVQTTAGRLFPHDASDASAYRTMAGRVDSGSVAKFTAAIAFCAAGRGGEAGVRHVAAQVARGQRPAAVQAVSAVAGSCIDTAVPPLQRLQAKAAQGPLTDAVLWVELKMAAK